MNLAKPQSREGLARWCKKYGNEMFPELEGIVTAWALALDPHAISRDQTLRLRGLARKNIDYRVD